MFPSLVYKPLPWTRLLCGIDGCGGRRGGGRREPEEPRPDGKKVLERISKETDKTDSAGYHKLQLTTKQKDDRIQAREGFYLEQ